MTDPAPALPPRPRIRGRDPHLAPPSRPIVESQVELFVPASSKPVVVRHALAQRLFYYFAGPLLAFALMAGIGVWVFMMVAREEALPKSRSSAGTTAASALAPVENTGAYLVNAPSELPASSGAGAASQPQDGVGPGNATRALAAFNPPPVLERVSSPQRARLACDAVRKLMSGKTLEEKLAYTTDPEAVKAAFHRSTYSDDVGRVELRSVVSEKQFMHGERMHFVVDATLFDFSKRRYIVREDGTQARILVDDPRNLLP